MKNGDRVPARPPLLRAGTSRGMIGRAFTRGWITLLAPALFLYLAVLVYPLVDLVRRSLENDHGKLTGSNYVQLTSTSLFRTVLLHTLEYSVYTSLLCLVLGYPVAYMINKLPPRRQWIPLLFILTPLFTSILVRSFAWIAILQDQGGINSALHGLGLISTPLPLLYSTTGLMIGMTNILLPYMVLPILSVMRGVNKSLVPAAQSLGASPSRAFWTVYFPQTISGVSAGVLVTFILALGFFITPELLGGRTNTMIAQLIELEVNQLANFGVASALATVLMVVTFVILAVYSRFFSVTKVLRTT
jgi:ABC-type spermidine/putrescine transport system permease subunit I